MDDLAEGQNRAKLWTGVFAARLTDAEAAALAQQISGITAAALPLADGLRAMAEEVPSSGFRMALLDLAARLEQGVSLDAALEQMRSRLPPHVSELVRAGVRSGRLGEILAQYVRHHSLGMQLRRRIVTSMAYPAVLFMVFLSVFLFLLVVIVPKFKRIYLDFGVELPDTTLALIGFSDWFIAVWQILLWGTLGSAVVTGVLCVLLLGPAARQRLFYRVPLVGRLKRWTRLAQFARLLAMLVDSDLPLPQALELAGGSVRDAEILDAARQLAREVESGESLAGSATRRSRFPPGLAQSLQWGEGAQSLAESLRTAAEMLEGQAMIQSEFVFRAAPPVAMILIVLGLSFVLTGLFSPLLKLITELSG